MAGRKTLKVEDNEDHRWIHVLWLQKFGACEISETSMGQEALNCIRRTPPDLRLLHLRLPGVDGWETPGGSVLYLLRSTGCPSLPSRPMRWQATEKKP
jgi:CheY-like chemotaxis protein